MNSENSKVRKPAVAGQFYPADPAELQAEVMRMLDIDIPKPKGTVRAIISPHAGYAYSGRVAAEGFSMLRGSSYSRILIIAPSHRVPFSGLATADYTAYSTPLGEIAVDLEAARAVIDYGHGIAHAMNAAHQGEHALEVQLPFLQEVLPNTPILPLICGRIASNFASKAAACLLQFWEPGTLWVISSDFTHFGYSFNYVPFTDDLEKNLKSLDMGAVEKILAMDGAGFEEYLHDTGATICGANPIKVLLTTIEASGTKELIHPELVECTNSGEISGDFSHCVGYSSIVFSDK